MIRRQKQLGNFITDIFQRITGRQPNTGDVFDIGRDITDFARDIHIPFQNAALQNMSDVVVGFNTAKTDGMLNASYIRSAQAAIRKISDDFTRYAKPLGGRAAAGADDIAQLAQRIINDMGAASGGYASGIGDFVSQNPLLIGGVVLFLLMRKK